AITAFKNIASSVFPGTPYNTAEYSPIHLELLGVYAIEMLGIINRIDTGEILKMIGHHGVFLKKTGISISRVNITISINPGLVKIGGNGYRISTSGVWKLRSGYLIAGN